MSHAISIMVRKSKELPPEVVEIVLVSLPRHTLCRCRLVCKAWNHMLTQPQFASLYATHASRQASSLLIVPKLRAPSSETPHDGETSWKVLDIEEKRFYVFSDGFCIADFIRRTSLPRFQGRWHQYTLAADKGLVYVMCASQGLGEPTRHIMCNPMTKEFHLIPEPKMPHHLNHINIQVVMAVDNAAQRYRIVANIANKSYLTTGIRRDEVHLYDSASKRWRVLCQGPDDYRACSSIFLKGVFYTLFVDIHEGLNLKLFSCDLETGAWSEANVALPKPSHPQDYKSQLVVALGRLFVMKYTGPPVREIWQRLQAGRKFVINVSIWEIMLGEQEARKVAEMSKFAKYSYEVIRWDYKEDAGDQVVAVGYGSSIVISSWTGRSVGFDLLNKGWYELPFEDLELLYAGYEHRQGIVASLVDF